MSNGSIGVRVVRVVCAHILQAIGKGGHLCQDLNLAFLSAPFVAVSREIQLFQGEIVLWANWKHVGSARAIYEQLR